LRQPVTDEMVSPMSGFTGNRRVGLAVVCTAQFVVVLDATIVTTALPSIRTALGFAPAGLSWVLTAYTLVFGSLLVTGGKAADLIGPRRAFGLGLLVFAAGSVLCAAAWAPYALIGARALQGLGAALLSPAALAQLLALSEPGPSRRRAVAWWTAVAAVGGASGWVLGGLFTEFLGWRTVFWVNLPIAALTLIAALRLLPPGETRRDTRPDWTGAFAITATLALVVYGLSENRTALPFALLPAALFGWRLRRSAAPVIPPRLLRRRATAGGGLTATTTPTMYLATLYVQQVLRLSPARASLLFPAFNVGVIAGSMGGPAVLRRVGPRRTLLAGFTAIGVGAALFAALPATGMPLGRLLTAFVVLGAGLGAASVASTEAGVEGTEPADRGVAAGLLNSCAQIGTSLGLAGLGPLAGSGRTGFLGVCLLCGAGLGAVLIIPGAASSAGRVSARPERSDPRSRTSAR
jgi:MFS family permease